MSFHLTTYTRQLNGIMTIAGRTYNVTAIHDDGFAELDADGKQYLGIKGNGPGTSGQNAIEIWSIQTTSGKGRLVASIAFNAAGNRIEVPR